MDSNVMRFIDNIHADTYKGGPPKAEPDPIAPLGSSSPAMRDAAIAALEDRRTGSLTVRTMSTWRAANIKRTRELVLKG